jgi:hypothetical protein
MERNIYGLKIEQVALKSEVVGYVLVCSCSPFSAIVMRIRFIMRPEISKTPGE